MLPISGERQRFPVSGKGPHTQCGSGQPGVRQIRQCSALQLRHPAAPRSTPQQRESCTPQHPAAERELHPAAPRSRERVAPRSTPQHPTAPRSTPQHPAAPRSTPQHPAAPRRRESCTRSSAQTYCCRAVALGATRDARPPERPGLSLTRFMSECAYVCVLFVGR